MIVRAIRSLTISMTFGEAITTKMFAISIKYSSMTYKKPASQAYPGYLNFHQWFCAYFIILDPFTISSRT